MKEKYLESISKSGLFRYLDESCYEQAWEELCMSVRSFTDKQTIYAQGEAVHRVAIVHEGLVKGEKFHEEGTSHLAHMYASGETFAFEGAVSGGKTSPLDFIAEGDAVIVFFDVERIYEGSFERELIRGFMELLANDNIKKMYRIEVLSQRGLRERILAYLRILAAKKESDTINLNMSRSQLAYYLCVNRTALSYELHKMKRDGVIALQGKKIKLL